ncbi:MAG TPA: transglutaminase-like domain-containing protein [Thermoanaerobaculia bacterium]|nr:transglutaminase-like domain-containing protein [Thermoanaerobaculia bacterium]
MEPATLSPTPILDHASPEVREVAARIGASHPSPRDYVRAAHHHLAETMRPVYSLEERFPVSRILREAKGSCSQRMACLEGLARAHGIATRVRALFLVGKFWAPRLPLLRRFLPERTLMPWPEFQMDGEWVGFDEIFAPLPELAAGASHRFTNRGVSMFEAVEKTPVDFFGKLRKAGSPRAADFDLTEFVAEDGGLFSSRDEMFAQHNPDPSRMGLLFFNLVYGGRTIRREPE